MTPNYSAPATVKVMGRILTETEARDRLFELAELDALYGASDDRALEASYLTEAIGRIREVRLEEARGRAERNFTPCRLSGREDATIHLMNEWNELLCGRFPADGYSPWMAFGRATCKTCIAAARASVGEAVGGSAARR